LRILVNEAAKIERSEFLGAKPYERTASRRDYANGFKPKTMLTRLGEVTFQVPQVRSGDFYPSALGRRAREPIKRSISRLPRCTSKGSPPGG
jgi:transposase-like protein